MLPAARVNGFAKRPERATPVVCDEPIVSVTDAGTVRIELTAPSGERLWITLDAFHARILHTRLGNATTAAEDRR
jgi:hypothetical protein